MPDKFAVITAEDANNATGGHAFQVAELLSRVEDPDSGEVTEEWRLVAYFFHKEEAESYVAWRNNWRQGITPGTSSA